MRSRLLSSKMIHVERGRPNVKCCQTPDADQKSRTVFYGTVEVGNPVLAHVSMHVSLYIELDGNHGGFAKNGVQIGCTVVPV